MKNAPLLMPFQDLPFNGDTFISNEFLKLKEQFGITTAVELGTCLGSTSLWMSNHFEKVITIEINPEFAAIANERFVEANKTNIAAYVGDTVLVLPSVIEAITDKSIFFIDSHWYTTCPMQDELRIIAERGIKPIIAIHDFLVPNEPNLGYDDIYGQPFTIEWIMPKLEAIYGKEGYNYYYNSDSTSSEIKRGIVYIVPNK